ncbi:MAG: hypothetical protein ABJP87_17895 [Bauldia litoralis]|uniref:hypothetical protein n=1 Tax=Alphaproteobacteria TaxID=28211 RepID=UPI00328BFF34
MKQGITVAYNFEETQLMSRSIVLTQEEPAAAWAVASILGQIEDGDKLLLLHNGSKVRSFCGKIREAPGRPLFRTA